MGVVQPVSAAWSALYERVLLPALREKALRDEIYCQVIKQITGNRSVEGTLRGWQLMDMCLQAFAPSTEFENYLESFIRAAAGQQQRNRLRFLHLILNSRLRLRLSPPSRNWSAISADEDYQFIH